MNKVVAPIQFDDRKPEVANFQDGLLLLIDRQLLTIPAEQLGRTISELTRERAAQVYARFTSRTVQTFQQQYAAQFSLPGSGTVDEPTAKALNQLLQQLGAFQISESVHPNRAIHVVNGAYTTSVNVTRKRAGRLFQGRYKRCSGESRRE